MHAYIICICILYELNYLECSDTDPAVGSAQCAMFQPSTGTIVCVPDPDMALLARQVQDTEYVEHWDLALLVATIWHHAQTHWESVSGTEEGVFVQQLFECVFVVRAVHHALHEFMDMTPAVLPWRVLRRVFQAQGPGAKELVQCVVHKDALHRAWQLVKQ
jgi:hypothetical protein